MQKYPNLDWLEINYVDEFNGNPISEFPLAFSKCIPTLDYNALVQFISYLQQLPAYYDVNRIYANIPVISSVLAEQWRMMSPKIKYFYRQ
jgi:hypothetical protein